MPRVSAGLLMYRRHNRRLEVLLAHPGGPYFRNKDAGVWTIPKGEPDAEEDLLRAAQREFKEETGFDSCPPFTALAPVTLKSGKIVHAWAFEGDCDVARLVSNTFAMEWPPKSRRHVDFPEVDRAEFFDLDTARQKINPAQIPLLDELEQIVSSKT